MNIALYLRSSIMLLVVVLAAVRFALRKQSRRP